MGFFRMWSRGTIYIVAAIIKPGELAHYLKHLRIEHAPG